MTLLTVNFPTRIPDCDYHSPALFYFFLLMLLFKLGASAAAIEFCEWCQVGANIYIYIYISL